VLVAVRKHHLPLRVAKFQATEFRRVLRLVAVVLGLRSCGWSSTQPRSSHPSNGGFHQDWRVENGPSLKLLAAVPVGRLPTGAGKLPVLPFSFLLPVAEAGGAVASRRIGFYMLARTVYFAAP
jgi:hypothetical protein